MTMMHFSKSTGGFYNTSVHGAAMPPDVVTVSAERYAELMEAQSHGSVIRSDLDGTPVAAVPTEAPSKAAARALATVRALRQGPLAVLDGLQVSALAAKDTAGAKAIEEAKQALRDAPAIVDDTQTGTYDERMARANAEFARIAELAPNVGKAFPGRQ